MKKEEDIAIEETEYKKVTKLNNEGKEIWVKNVPKVDPNIHASGLHTIIGKPEEDHYDHQENGRKWKEYTK